MLSAGAEIKKKGKARQAIRHTVSGPWPELKEQRICSNGDLSEMSP